MVRGGCGIGGGMRTCTAVAVAGGAAGGHDAASHLAIERCGAREMWSVRVLLLVASPFLESEAGSRSGTPPKAHFRSAGRKTSGTGTHQKL